MPWTWSRKGTEWVVTQAAGPAEPNNGQETDSDAVLTLCRARGLAPHT